MSSELFSAIMLVAGILIGGFITYFKDTGKDNKKRDLEIKELQIRVHKLEGGHAVINNFFIAIKEKLTEMQLEIEKLKK